MQEVDLKSSGLSNFNLHYLNEAYDFLLEIQY